jgi:hypothetical protein
MYFETSLSTAQWADTVETALELLKGRQITIGSETKVMTGFHRIRDKGFCLQFGEESFLIAIAKHRSRPKHHERQRCIHANRFHFFKTLFVYENERTETILHKIRDCIKT